MATARPERVVFAVRGVVALASAAMAAQFLLAGSPRAPRAWRRAEGPPRVSKVVNATVRVDPAEVLRNLPSDLFGSSIQYPEYGDGILDPATWTFHGDAVEAIGELGLATIRFPGGSHSDVYHWRDGVGPRELRPPGAGYLGGVPTSNAYGTDEHLAFCAEIGAVATITANFGTGTPREAANWVEYCNGEAPIGGTEDWTATSWGGGDTAPSGYFAWLRSHFGHPAPYGVERWEVGNEVYNDWSDTYSASQYATRFVDYVQAMKAADETIRVAAVGYDRAEDGWHGDPLSWNRQVARIAGGVMDALHVHTYTPLADGRSIVLTSNASFQRNVTAPVTGTYTFELLAQGVSLYGPYPPPKDGEHARLELRVDGGRSTTFDLRAPFPAYYRVAVDLTAGPHLLTLSFMNALWDPPAASSRFVVLAKTATCSLGGAEITVRFGEEEAVDTAVMAGATAIARELTAIESILREETDRDDIELWITEYNAFYGLLGLRLDQTQEFKSAVAVADMAAGAMVAGVDLLQLWSVIRDWHFGMVTDERSLGLRSFARTVSLLREGTFPNLLASTVEVPTFALAAPFGTVPALSDVPVVGATATGDEGRVAVFLVNRDLERGADVTVEIKGVGSRTAGNLTWLWSEGPDTVDVTPPVERLSFVAGKVGGALLLEDDRYVRFPVTDRISGREGTVELWVRPEWDGDDGLDHALLSLGWLFQISRHHDGIVLAAVLSEMADDVDLAVGDAHAWEAGEWHHVAVTWQEGGELRVFLDGARVGSAPRTVPWRYVEPAYGLLLGTTALNPSSTLNGALDEVRLSTRARSASEIAASWVAGRRGQPLVVDADTALLLHLDGDLVDSLRDERTRRTSRVLAAGPPNVGVYLPPCSVALVVVEVPAPASGSPLQREKVD